MHKWEYNNNEKTSGYWIIFKVTGEVSEAPSSGRTRSMSQTDDNPTGLSFTRSDGMFVRMHHRNRFTFRERKLPDVCVGETGPIRRLPEVNCWNHFSGNTQWSCRTQCS
ncbi:hypothetical protein CDAR_266481 [Caerostris darwini]|uniref:Uncharacterized protein n=1 Tax=Caerostris darwini TaxID=1538125 RepID=A0AAV4TIV5_9ARAC|nr:hypothetical protein CDAR_266481 [Caerostris darwini]